VSRVVRQLALEALAAEGLRPARPVTVVEERRAAS
jgi:hypothetical protein